MRRCRCCLGVCTNKSAIKGYVENSVKQRCKLECRVQRKYSVAQLDFLHGNYYRIKEKKSDSLGHMMDQNSKAKVELKNPKHHDRLKC